jgi:hypothetical protein
MLAGFLIGPELVLIWLYVWLVRYGLALVCPGSLPALACSAGSALAPALHWLCSVFTLALVISAAGFDWAGPWFLPGSTPGIVLPPMGPGDLWLALLGSVSPAPLTGSSLRSL